VDECAQDVSKCDQNCSNTEGSYTCLCNIGYTLNEDGYTCDGKYKGITYYAWRVNHNCKVIKTFSNVEGCRDGSAKNHRN